MKAAIIAILTTLTLVSCSPQRSLSRKYEGKGREQIISEFGEPQSIQTFDNGNQMFEYVKETVIRDTPIGTGRHTIEPMISPGFVKVEVRQFIIDNKGIVTNTNYEKLYR